MNKKVVIACTLTVFLIAGILYSLPYVTIYRIIAAFEGKDTQQLSELVDFPQIRENLKLFIGTKLQTEPAATKPDAWGQIQKSMTSRIIAGVVEEIITPEGLASFLEKRLEAMVVVQEGANKKKPTPWQLFSAFISHADLAYTSPSEFIIAFKGTDAGQVRLALRRKGMTWRLTNIEF